MAEPDVVVVQLTNRWASFIESYPEDLRKYYSYKFPNYYFSPKFRAGIWDGTICLLKHRRVPAGLFLATRRKIESEAGIVFDVYDTRKRLKYKPVSASMTDRQFQWDCLAAMQKTRTGGLVLCATGTGKTFIAGIYFKSLIGTGCFIVDELTLLDQAREELQHVLGEEVGYIGNSKFNPARITVATIQTLHRHRFDRRFREWQSKLNAMIVDEVHIALNKRNVDTVKNIQPAVVFGLTATLQMKKVDVRMRAHALAGPVLYEYSMQTGVQEQYLTPGVSIGLDIVRSGIQGRDYQEDYQDYIVNSFKWNNAIIQLVREAHRRKYRIIVLVERVRHLKKLSKALSDIPHRLAFGEKKVKERTMAKEDFDAGKIRLLIANKVFKKGVNLKSVSLIIDGASMSSENDAVQKFGRGVRLCSGKTGLIYIDVGYKSVASAKKGEEGYNRFDRSARRRRRALRKIGIKVESVVWDRQPKQVLDKAEKILKRLIPARN